MILFLITSEQFFSALIVITQENEDQELCGTSNQWKYSLLSFSSPGLCIEKDAKAAATRFLGLLELKYFEIVEYLIKQSPD